ncbi:hypothetical protein [Aeromonas caviae]|uniref:hypothetical protein n=1 Tax=Aeromonas caviae TaxID=648 RepID=UPI001112FB54|nr:hypothetical protein [Aeromonas caviae]MDY7842516.1 hypothetical protein [Aeromonas caviae]
MQGIGETELIRDIISSCKVTPSERKALHKLILVRDAVVYVVCGYVLVVTLHIMSHKYGLVASNNKVADWVILFIVVLSIYKIHTRRVGKLIDKADASVAHYLAESLGSLKRVDYYSRELSSGLAVDVENKAIAIVEGDDDKPETTRAVVYPLSKIIKVKFYEEGYSSREYSTSFNTGGVSGAVQNLAAATFDNYFNGRREDEAKAKAAKYTGLYFEIDDIHKQTAFVMMRAKFARKWLVIFNKLRDGSLEIQPKPMEFPRPEDMKDVVR